MTHNQENVLDMQWMEVGELPPEDLDPLSRTMAFHLRKLIDERDESSEVCRLAFRLKLSAGFYMLYKRECVQSADKENSSSNPCLKFQISGLCVCFIIYLFLLAGLGADSRKRLLAVTATP